MDKLCVMRVKCTVHAVITGFGIPHGLCFWFDGSKCKGHKGHVLNIPLFEVNISYLMLYFTTRRKDAINASSLFFTVRYVNNFMLSRT